MTATPGQRAYEAGPLGWVSRGIWPPVPWEELTPQDHAWWDKVAQANDPWPDWALLADARQEAERFRAENEELRAHLAAQGARPAPGPAGCECGHAQTGHAFSDDVCAVPGCPCPGYRRTPRPAPGPAYDPNHEPGLSECGCRTCDPQRRGITPAAELAAAIDPGKLDLLADWFDRDDAIRGRLGNPEVQADLRRWAKAVRDHRKRAGLPS